MTEAERIDKQIGIYKEHLDKKQEEYRAGHYKSSRRQLLDEMAYLEKQLKDARRRLADLKAREDKDATGT
jgi:hypothetical protein